MSFLRGTSEGVGGFQHPTVSYNLFRIMGALHSIAYLHTRTWVDLEEGYDMQSLDSIKHAVSRDIKQVLPLLQGYAHATLSPIDSNLLMSPEEFEAGHRRISIILGWDEEIGPTIGGARKYVAITCSYNAETDEYRHGEALVTRGFEFGPDLAE